MSQHPAATGAFGDIHTAYLTADSDHALLVCGRRCWCSHADMLQVAVKRVERASRLRKFTRVRTVTATTLSHPSDQRLANEITTWRRLSHPNILPFRGLWFAEDSPLPALVSPWCSNGSINRYLRDPTVFSEKLRLVGLCNIVGRISKPSFSFGMSCAG